MSMAKVDEIAGMFKVLSVDKRVRILKLLAKQTLCVGALSCSLKISPSAVSQHLRIMRDAKLVIPEKRGYYIHYRLNDKTVAKWKNAMAGLLSPVCEKSTICPNEKGETLCVEKSQNANTRKS